MTPIAVLLGLGQGRLRAWENVRQNVQIEGEQVGYWSGVATDVGSAVGGGVSYGGVLWANIRQGSQETFDSIV